MLYSDLWEQETSWAHIMAIESTISRFGIPLRYYVDCHSIFRFVQGRNSIWRDHRKLSDDSTPQWKQVLDDLNINVTYALSPQAKGKIERPYRWLQDHLVRTCAKKTINKIKDAREILKNEMDRYNNRQIHNTTNEIPAVRFDRALKSNKSLFRDYIIPKPYESSKDIFCFRTKRVVDAYHKISINGQEFKVKGVPLREAVEIKIIPNIKLGIAELRFWYKNMLVDKQIIKISSLYTDQF